MLNETPEAILAVDPGKKVAAAAVFLDGRLEAATLVRGTDPLDLCNQIVAWTGTLSFSVVVTENQQVYGGPRRSDPNDLLPLAFCCGAVHASYDTPMRIMPLPRKWKGTIKKEIMTARILSKLSDAERDVIDTISCPKSLLHNVVDACGLGLWHLGRL